MRREVKCVHQWDAKFSIMKAAREEGALLTNYTAAKAAALPASLGAFKATFEGHSARWRSGLCIQMNAEGYKNKTLLEVISQKLLTHPKEHQMSQTAV